MSKADLRMIAVSYKDIEAGECGEGHDEPEDESVKDIEKDGLTLIALVGVGVIVRPGIPEAVAKIQAAGYTVRMVTVNNIDRAKHIAIKCNIISEEEKDDESVALEGPHFFEIAGGLDLTEEGMKTQPVKDLESFKKVEKKCRILARTCPEHLYLMIAGLNELGHQVAITGDQSNDWPTLNYYNIIISKTD